MVIPKLDRLKVSSLINNLRHLKLDRQQIIITGLVLALPFFYLSGYGAGRSSSPSVESSSLQKVALQKKIVIGDLNFSIQDFELNNQIVIDNKPLKAPPDKEFLIIHFFIDNPTSETIKIQPVNLFRLTDNQNHKYAPELFNKTTTIYPKSTKTDQVAFFIDKASLSLNLEFGDVNNSEKTIVEIKK